MSVQRSRNSVLNYRRDKGDAFRIEKHIMSKKATDREESKVRHKQHLVEQSKLNQIRALETLQKEKDFRYERVQTSKQNKLAQEHQRLVTAQSRLEHMREQEAILLGRLKRAKDVHSTMQKELKHITSTPVLTSPENKIRAEKVRKSPLASSPLLPSCAPQSHDGAGEGHMRISKNSNSTGDEKQTKENKLEIETPGKIASAMNRITSSLKNISEEASANQNLQPLSPMQMKFDSPILRARQDMFEDAPVQNDIEAEEDEERSLMLQKASHTIGVPVDLSKDVLPLIATSEIVAPLPLNVPLSMDIPDVQKISSNNGRTGSNSPEPTEILLKKTLASTKSDGGFFDHNIDSDNLSAMRMGDVAAQRGRVSSELRSERAVNNSNSGTIAESFALKV